MSNDSHKLQNAEHFADTMKMPLLVGQVLQDGDNCDIAQCRYDILPNAPLVITKEFMRNHNIQVVLHVDKDNKQYESYKSIYNVPVQMGRFQWLCIS